MAVGFGWARKIWSKIWSRRTLVGALIVLGALVMFVGSLTLWVKRQVLDTDNWVETSSQLLDNDDIRHAVAIRISDAAFEQADLASRLPPALARLAPALQSSLEQFAVQAADNFLARPRVQELWAVANGSAHRAFLAVVTDEAENVSVQDGAVVLDLRPIVLEFAAERGIEDTVAARLPEDAGQITIMESDKLEVAQDVVALLQKASVLIILIAIGLYALAIWLAKGHRREAVRAIAVSWLVIAVIILIMRRLAGDALVEAIAEGDSAESVGDQTWAIATNLMADLAYAILVAGAVMLVCTWLLGPSRFAVAVRSKLASPLRHHPVLAYGVLAFVFMLIVLWGPTGARRLLGIVILGVLLFVTLELLRRKTAREFPESAPDTEPAPDTQPPAPTASAPST
jgi:hypothetical protein